MSAINVACTHCGAQLKLKDQSKVGRKVACPKCRKPFVIEAPAEDSEFDFPDLGDFEEDLDAPLPPPTGNRAPSGGKSRKKKKKKKASRSTSGDGLLRVAKGLDLVLIALAIKVLLFMGALIVGVLPDNIERLVGWVVPGGGLAAGVLSLVALSYCLATPAESGARGLMIAVLVIESVTFLLSIASLVISVFGELPSTDMVVLPVALLGISSSCLSMLSPVLFLLFLKTLSRHIDYPAGDEEVMDIFKLVVVAIAVPVMVCCTVLVPGIGLLAPIFIVIGELIVMIMILFKYIDLLAAVRDRIRVVA